MGLILYPLGWGSKRVKDLCGDHAAAFLIDDCQLGKHCCVMAGLVVSKVFYLLDSQNLVVSKQITYNLNKNIAKS